jgi:regulation of enolase protein 1 (concanavalin A-like superfamily)
MLCSLVMAKDEIPGWGKPVDSDGDCQFNMNGNDLVILAPPTHGLSIELGRMNAPRVLRMVNGDFVLEVKVEGDFAPGSKTVPERTPYNGAGLLVMSDDKNYVSLVRAVLTLNNKDLHYANFEVRENGAIQRFGRVEDLSLDPAKPTWLRLERRGDTILGSVRQDNGVWVNLPEKTAKLSNETMVGVAAVNASSKPFQTRFADISLYTASNAP